MRSGVFYTRTEETQEMKTALQKYVQSKHQERFTGILLFRLKRLSLSTTFTTRRPFVYWRTSLEDWNRHS